MRYRMNITELLQTHYGVSIISEVTSEEKPEDLIGETINNYRVTGILSQGGMATIYQAVRSDNEFQRNVAIKFIKPTLTDEKYALLFASERQILAKLTHPNIAQLHDSGFTDRGHPFFIMEYVQGQHLDTYLKQNSLPLRKRIELFEQVLVAVAFAHEQLIVHRDLKPSNILVDKRRQVKLLDFGIAQYEQNPVQGAGEKVNRRQQETPLTYRFCSPEILDNQQPGLKTDIFQLGLLLHIAVYGTHVLDLLSYQEIKTVLSAQLNVGEQRQRLSSDGVLSTSLSISKSRQQELDAIIHCCLRQKPDDRYQSVSALHQDIRRFLQFRCVSALPDTLPYRSARFLQRNAILSWSTCSLVLLLVVGSWYHLENLNQARDIAEREADRASKTTQFISQLFVSNSPATIQSKEIQIVELVHRARQSMSEEFSDDPELLSQINMTLAKMFVELLEVDVAQELLFSLSDKVTPRTKAQRNLLLAKTYLTQGDNQEALRTSQQAYHFFLSEKWEYPQSWVESGILLSEAHFNSGQIEESNAILADITGAIKGMPDNPLLLAELYFRKAGQNYYDDQQMMKSLLQKSLRIFTEVKGDHYYRLAAVYRMLGVAEHVQNNFREAEAFFQQSLNILLMYEAISEKKTIDLYTTMGVNAWVGGDLMSAQDYYQKALQLATLQHKDNPNHMDLVALKLNISRVSFEQGKLAETEALLLASQASFIATSNEQNPRYQILLNELATFYLTIGFYDRAMTYAQAALDMADKGNDITVPTISSKFIQAKAGCLLQKSDHNYIVLQEFVAANDELIRAKQYLNWRDEILAVCADSASRKEETLTLLQRAIERRLSNNPKDLDLARTYYLKAWYDWKYQHFNDARSGIAQSLDFMRENRSVYGESHPQYILAKALQFRILWELNEMDNHLAEFQAFRHISSEEIAKFPALSGLIAPVLASQ